MTELEPAKKYAKGLAAHEGLANEVVACICEQGYHAASVADFVSRAGLSKNQFFHHFGSKENAGLVAVARCRAAWQSEVLAAAEVFPESRTRLAKMNTQLVELTGAGWPHLKLLAMLTGELSSLPEQLQVEVQALHAELVEYLRQNYKDFKKEPGVLLNQKARILAQLNLALWLGSASLDAASVAAVISGFLGLTQLAP